VPLWLPARSLREAWVCAMSSEGVHYGSGDMLGNRE